MTKTDFAAKLHLSKARVSQLVKAGLPVEPDGSIDAGAASAWYKRNVAAKSTTVVPASVATGSDDGDSFFEARRKREWVRLEKESLELARLTDRLVDAEEVKAAAFEVWRNERDALQNLPARIAPLIAAELGIDEHQLYQAIEKHLRAFLEERSLK